MIHWYVSHAVHKLNSHALLNINANGPNLACLQVLWMTGKCSSGSCVSPAADGAHLITGG